MAHELKRNRINPYNETELAKDLKVCAKNIFQQILDLLDEESSFDFHNGEIFPHMDTFFEDYSYYTAPLLK